MARRCVARASSGLSLAIVSARVPTYVTFERPVLHWSWWDAGPLTPGGYRTSPEIASRAPDPYVRDASGRFRTVTAWNTYAPTWDEVVATGWTPEQLAAPIELDVWDDDQSPSYITTFDDAGNVRAMVDEPIAHFVIRLRPEQRVAGRLTFTLGSTAQERVTLTIELR